MKKTLSILLILVLGFSISTPILGATLDTEDSVSPVASDTGFACPLCYELGDIQKIWVDPLSGTITNILYCENCDYTWSYYQYYSLRNLGTKNQLEVAE